jgi:hypothetical protein
VLRQKGNRLLALSATEGIIVLSATAAVVLAALVAFMRWWLRPMRSRAVRRLGALEQRERERRTRDRRD